VRVEPSDGQPSSNSAEELLARRDIDTNRNIDVRRRPRLTEQRAGHRAPDRVRNRKIVEQRRDLDDELERA
jgi:hypothetical protein